MTQQRLPMTGIEPDNGTILSAVTVIEREVLVGADREERARIWNDIHESTRARLAASLARFIIEHNVDVTFHHEPAYCVTAWEGDTNAIGYVLAAKALPHRDLSHMLPVRDDEGKGDWIRLCTRCGCESRTMRYPSPLPQTIHKSVSGGGVRTFRKGGVNVFGATTYNEVG